MYNMVVGRVKLSWEKYRIVKGIITWNNMAGHEMRGTISQDNMDCRVVDGIISWNGKKI